MNIIEKVPTVGFVSLGCPKASADAELILTPAACRRV
jgi:ribosomal protein S12 methylthiotransferase